MALKNGINYNWKWKFKSKYKEIFFITFAKSEFIKVKN